MANIKARRKLSDLYKKGVEVRFGPNDTGEVEGRVAPGGQGAFKDDDGKPLPLGEDDVAMWIQPPSPLQREMALRDAQAARARALIRAKRDENSEEHLSVLAFLADMTDETLIEYVMVSTQDDRSNEATREVLALDEWQDITAYQDAMRQFDEMDPAERDENPEYIALMEKDEKFGEQVRQRTNELADAERDVLTMRGRAETEKRALEKRAELVGSQAFMREYEQQMLFYAVRDADDTGVLFFESARELAEQDDAIREVIQEALVPFITDGSEAKNSPGVASGSESSEPPKKPETSEASTQPDASE